LHASVGGAQLSALAARGVHGAPRFPRARPVLKRAIYARSISALAMAMAAIFAMPLVDAIKA